MKKIIVSLALLAIYTNMLGMNDQKTLTLLKKANASIRPFSKIECNPRTKDCTIKELDNLEITQIKLIAKKGKFITLSIYFKKEKPKFFVIEQINKNPKMKKEMDKIVRKIQTSYKSKNPAGEEMSAALDS